VPLSGDGRRPGCTEDGQGIEKEAYYDDNSQIISAGGNQFLGTRRGESQQNIFKSHGRRALERGRTWEEPFPILGLGERLHPELDAIFVSSPDKTGAQLPPVGELRRYWDEVNGKLLSQFAILSADEWLHRHYAMSEEDYAKDPTRNRLAVLLSRTNHMSYHLGQITLAIK
jgi:hypothetical protein